MDLGLELHDLNLSSPGTAANAKLDDKLPLLPGSVSSKAPSSSSSSSSSDRAPRGAGLGSSVFNLATTIIGAGIMALPATMRVLGLPLGFLAIIFMGIISEASLEMLILFSTHFRVWSYGETVQIACKSGGRKLAEICIMVNNAGILIVYLIIIGEVLSGSKDGEHIGLLDQFAGGHHGWWSNRSITIFLTLVFVLTPLCCLKRIDSLAVSSAISVLLAVLFVLLSTCIAALKLASGSLERPRMLPDTSSMLDLLVVIPIMTNAYICHFNVHPIYKELHHPTPDAMTRVGRISTLLCVVVYAMTAISGYLLFGDSTASDVLTNFDKNLGIRYSSVLNGLIRVGYVVHLMLVFPVIHFSLRQTVLSFFFPTTALESSTRRFVWVTALMLTLVYLGSAFIPNIWIAFQFTGATTGLSLGFIFPALVGIRWWHILDIGPRKQRIIFLGSWSMLVMAVLVSFIGIVGNILSLIQGWES